MTTKKKAKPPTYTAAIVKFPGNRVAHAMAHRSAEGAKAIVIVSAEEFTRLRRIEIAARAWWFGRRPVAFSAAEHREHPTVNTLNKREASLALAVAGKR